MNLKKKLKKKNKSTFRVTVNSLFFLKINKDDQMSWGTINSCDKLELKGWLPSV